MINTQKIGMLLTTVALLSVAAFAPFSVDVGTGSVNSNVAHAAYDGGGSGGTCCGGGGTTNGGGGGSRGDTNPPPVIIVQHNPVCVISASPTSIAPGDSTLLTFNSSYASSASISTIGAVPVSGMKMVSNLLTTTTFVMTVSNGEETATCQTTVTVTPPPPAKPYCTITATPSSINQGGTSMLSWTSSNATSASLDQGIGSVAVNSSKTVGPSMTTTYTLSVSGPGGTATCNTTVVVVPPTKPACTLSANPMSINPGDSSILTWTSLNGTSAIIETSDASISVSVPVNGSHVVWPLMTTTYTLTVSGNGGTAVCPVTVYVTPKPKKPTCTITLTPQANANDPYSQIAILAWTSTDATSVMISPAIGSVGLFGSLPVYFHGGDKYTMTVTGPGGTAICKTFNECPAKY